MGSDVNWDVDGKTCIVTGATAGIGREAAAALAARGARVVLACRDVPLAHKVAQQIRQKHPGCDVTVGPALDLGSMESVRVFAAAYRAQGRPLHLLVNNAGANNLAAWHTPEGIGGLCQVNFLGPYQLTRLLEPVLIQSSPARIVNVSSTMHRCAALRPFAAEPAGSAQPDGGGELPAPDGGGRAGDDPGMAALLRSWRRGSGYATTKLANVLFAYECQRRLGALGVQSCAVDPGGVASNIWKRSVFESPQLSWLLHLYAPPSDGATAVVHAATVPWGSERGAAARLAAQRRAAPAAGSNGLSFEPEDDLRFYARGLFASPPMTAIDATPGRGLHGALSKALWVASAGVLSVMDWPARRLSGGRLAAHTTCVPSSPTSYDAELAARLWNAAADAARVPREVQAPGGRGELGRP